ncbi:competence protein CoiA family protein [Paenibacillus sp. M.A.Huq-84]
MHLITIILYFQNGGIYLIYAFDSSNGSMVAASDPKLYRSGKYICPVCRAPVHLRKGYERVSYFAHNSGRALPSCELYTPGNIDASYVQNQQTREPAHRTLNLYLKVIEERATELSWILELGIPEPDINHGRIEISFGWDGRRVVPVNMIKQGGFRLRIRPQIDDYHIECDGIREGRWRERITQPIGGIDRSQITVFRYSINGGRRINKNSPLYWGRSYIIIWTTGYGPKWWPHSSLMSYKPLRSQGSFHGAFIHLLAENNKHITEWLIEHLSHPVLHPLAELNLIAPLPEALLPDGSYIIPDGKKVLIGITGESGARKWEEVNGYHWDSNIKHTSFGTGIIPSQIELDLDSGRSDIWLDDEIEDSLQIVVEKKSASYADIPCVTLLANSVNGLGQVKAFLHSEEAEKLILEAYSGNIQFIEVEIPLHISVNLKWRDSAQDEWRIEKFASDDKDKIGEVCAQFIAALNTLIDRKVSYLLVDAGPFGRIDHKFEKSTRDLLLSIDSPMRERAAFLISLSQALKPVSPFNYKLNFDIEMFCEQDQQLINKILGKKYWPISLIPYVRTLLKEYQMVYQKLKNIR